MRFARQRPAGAAFAAWVLAAVRNGVGVEDGYADTLGWLSWKSGTSRGELRRLCGRAELCELLPETGAAVARGSDHHRGGRVDRRRTRPGLRRGARSDRGRVPRTRACVVITSRLQMLTAALPGLCAGRWFEAGAAGWGHGRRRRRPGSATRRLRQGRTPDRARRARTFTRPPTVNDESTLAHRQAEGLIRICEIALARGTDAEGARPVVSYLTQERTPVE